MSKLRIRIVNMSDRHRVGPSVSGSHMRPVESFDISLHSTCLRQWCSISLVADFQEDDFLPSFLPFATVDHARNNEASQRCRTSSSEGIFRRAETGPNDYLSWRTSVARFSRQRYAGEQSGVDPSVVVRIYRQNSSLLEFRYCSAQLPWR
jgi:hypothetical protein